MPRIIECPDEPERMTFSQFFNNHQSQQDSASTYLVTDPDDVETASESETSPILYSLRDKKVVSQSSQLLFLSQMNDAMDSPSTPSISVQQTSQHKAKAPNLLKPLKQAKPPSKVRSWEMESLTKSSSYYQQLISRFRSFILSVGNISSHFTARELPFIFSQNRLSFSRTASKTHLSSTLCEYIRNGTVSVPQHIYPSPAKPQMVPRMKTIARYSDHTLTSPSVETLLYSEFPRLYQEYNPKPPTVLCWDEDKLIVSSEFPTLTIHRSHLSIPPSQLTLTPSYQETLLSILHEQSYPCNYWSCYNEDLFDFPQDSPIVIVVPMYAEKETLLQSLYYHGKELTDTLPFLSVTVLNDQLSLPKWIEVNLIDKQVFTILHGYFVYLLTVKFKDHTYHTIQLPWQLSQSSCFVSLSMLGHYVGKQPPSFNPCFDGAPVALSWIPKEGEIIAVQVHDCLRGCELLELGEIKKVLDPFHLLVQWLRIAGDSCKGKCRLEYSPKETVLFPWDVYSIVMTIVNQK